MNLSISYILVIIFVLLSINSANLFGSEKKVYLAVNKIFEIYSAKDGIKGDVKCKNYYGNCLLLLNDVPAMTISNFKYSIIDGKKPGLIISLSKKEQNKLQEVSGLYLNKRLAVVYRGKILHYPKVKAVIKADSFIITFCNKRSYLAVINSLNDSDKENSGKEKLDDSCDCEK